MVRTYCPECDALVGVVDPEIGDRFVCSACNVELQVISIDPFDVYFPYDEDWDDYEYVQ